MSRFDSRDDYEDFQQGDRPDPCGTPFCDGHCDNAMSAFCYRCRVRDLEREADVKALAKADAFTRGARKVSA